MDKPHVWALIVHGGAKTIPPALQVAHEQGVRVAAQAGAAVLAASGEALDAVEAAVRSLESDPTFNAGFGAALNADGEVELDASIMDGRSLQIGAIGAVRGLRHPVSVARLLLPETAMLLTGDGAHRFAEDHGAELCDPEDLIAASGEAQTGGDTVGCVALDVQGHMACGLSTGGLDAKHPGRLGDSPLPGCGFYADDTRGAVAFSGDGESIARLTLAACVMAQLDSDGPHRALQKSLEGLVRTGGEAGGIALDRLGRFGCAHTSKNFAIAAASSNGALRAGVVADALGDLIDHD